VVAAAGLLLGTAACAPPAEPGTRSISIGIGGELDVNWNPLAAAWSVSPTLQAVYDGLFLFDPATREYIPWLAEEFELSDDGLTLSLVLRDDVDFVDGVHMDAEGVAEYFTTLLASDGYAFGFDVDKFGLQFTPTAEYTLDITSVLPIRDDILFTFWGNLSQTPVASPESLKTPEVFAEGPVGSGPYVIKKQRFDTITFERNPDYWNPEAFDFDEVTVTAFADRIAAFNALKAGQIDVTAIDISMAADAEASGFDLTFSRQAFVGLYIADRDGSQVPALADVRVRQAMSMALDREAINEAINNGYGAVGTEPFTEDQIGYVEEAEDRNDYDLEDAKELMAEAGYADGFDLTIPTPAYLSGAEPYFPIIQQSFSEIGIRVTYEPSQDLFRDMADGKYAVAPSGGPFSWVWSLLPLLWGGYNDARVEELVATMEGTLSKDEYEQTVDELGEIYVNELWFVVVAQPYEVYATNAEVDVARLDVSTDTPILRDYTAAD
jgi:peptide/nickel transport system substrate-binding protein